MNINTCEYTMNAIYKHRKQLAPLLCALLVIVALIYSVKLALTVIGGFIALLFGDNQRKRTELETKTAKIEEVERESRAVADEIERVNEAQRDATEKLTSQRESEVDQWLDS